MATYACSDLHGRYDIYENICKLLMPGDKVYFLGDAADRGPDGWKLIKAIATNPQFVYIKGNHEDMLVKAGREILREDFHGDWVRNLRHNGGYNTLQDWQMEEERFQPEWLNFLDKLPEVEEYVNIDGLRIHLSHAGFTPRTFDQFETDFLWDRDHFQDKWDSVNFPRMIVVHGHTPNCYVDDEINPASDVEIIEGAYWYCDNHKICLDTGAVWSDVAVLLDLDDFTEYIIKGENE